MVYLVIPTKKHLEKQWPQQNPGPFALSLLSSGDFLPVWNRDSCVPVSHLIHQSRCQGAINKPRLESKIPNVSKRLVLPNTRGHFRPSKCVGCFSHLIFTVFQPLLPAMRTGDGANWDIVTSISSPHFAQEHIINVVVGRGAISSEASPGRSCFRLCFIPSPKG